MQHVGISTHQFVPYHASAVTQAHAHTHTHTHTHILKSFEDSESTGLKVDIAGKLTVR